MNKKRTTALVIGGNIGGLCAAVALQRIGIDVTVFERGDGQRPQHAGLMLWINAINAFQQIGLADQVQAISTLGKHGYFLSQHGDELFRMSAVGVRRRSGVAMFLVDQADLHDLLLNTLGKDHVRTQTECLGFTQNEATVTARFTDGSTTSGDLLVGADGLRSVVRAQLLGDKPPRYSGYTAWRAIVDYQHPRLKPGVGSVSWGPGQRFFILPLDHGRVYWFAIRNAPEGTTAPLCGYKGELLTYFRGWHEPIEALITATPEQAILHPDLYDRAPLQHWGAGRVTLAGEAAHPMTPDIGQCACQTIEDAAVLADCLHTHDDVIIALRAYETSRASRARNIVWQSRWIGKISQLEHPLICTLRDHAMRLLPRGFQAKRLVQVVHPAQSNNKLSPSTSASTGTMTAAASAQSNDIAVQY